eukprot:768443-Hanusia_phi.AAC.4
MHDVVDCRRLERGGGGGGEGKEEGDVVLVQELEQCIPVPPHVLHPKLSQQTLSFASDLA